MTKFSDLGLKQEILEGIEALGYEQPMPVQEKVIPAMLADRKDLVALAQTGTGKTAAFGLPLLQLLDVENTRVQALVLSPTRELCMQIAKDIENYASKMRGVHIIPVYGGENIMIQYKKLRQNPQIVVATPGRLIDLIRRGKIDLSAVTSLVLDEADEMLNMGFQEDLETILSEVPSDRRTLLFSATMPKEIARISKKYMHDAEEFEIGTRNSGAENVEHVYYMVRASNRYEALKRIVDVNPSIYGIVFCRTRQETKDVSERLMEDGYNADALHGDLSQPQRDTVMAKFRSRHLQLLVATDVAARGLDVSDLTHVINYNLPDDAEIYTHRSGRTGRANNKGVSIVIVHSRERHKIRAIERVIKKEFTRGLVPTGDEICKKQLFAMIDKMEKVEVNETEIAPFMPELEKKLDYLSKEDLLRRFVSLEFNRFLEYYDTSRDINVSESSRDKDRGRDRDDSNKVCLKLSMGRKQNVEPRTVLSILNEVTDSNHIRVGHINILPKFTLFDVQPDQAEEVLKAFENSTGVTVTVPSSAELSEASSSSRGGRGGSRGGSRGGYRGSSDRGGYKGSSDRGGYRGSSDRGGYRGSSDRRNSSSSDRSRSYGKRSSDSGSRPPRRRSTSSYGDKPWRD